MSKDTDQQNNETHTPLAGAVLERIESEKICPTSRWYFLFSEFTMWSLWILSVIIGAAAMAVMLYVFTHAGYAFYEATHETWFEFVAEAAPWLWLSVFVLMAGIAHFNMRCTKKGYKYPLWQILLSSLILSVFGGVLLHYAGAGLMIESTLAKKVPMYASYEKLERDWWLKPDEGLLIGQFMTEETSSSAANFLDVNEREWVIVTEELLRRDLNTLHSGEMVKVIGLRGSTSASVFHGCGVFPWMHKKQHTREDMKKARESFSRMIDDYKEKVATNLIISRELESTTTKERPDNLVLAKVCPRMPVVKRALKRPQ